MPGPCWWRQPGRRAKRLARCAPSSCGSVPSEDTRLPPWRLPDKLAVILLASADQGNRVPLAAAGAGGPQGQVHGVAGWAAHTQGKQAWARAHAYHVKDLRDREIEVARQAECAYEHAVKNWQPARPTPGRTGAAKEAATIRLRGGLHLQAPLFAARPTRARGGIPDRTQGSLAHLQIRCSAAEKNLGRSLLGKCRRTTLPRPTVHQGNGARRPGTRRESRLGLSRPIGLARLAQSAPPPGHGEA